MNRVYKVIWSKAKHCYVVTSEIARSVTKSASSARSAGRKGAAVLAMAALLFTAGGVLGEAANVTDIEYGKTADVIMVTKDDGTTTPITINDVYHAMKANSDGDGLIINENYVKNADARVSTDGEYVKKDKKVGENLSALDAQVKANKDHIDAFVPVAQQVGANAEALGKLDQKVKDNLKVGDDGVISKVTGDDGTTPSAVNTLVLNKDDKNQITLSGDGIKVGLNSGVMDKDGFYAGGDTADKAKAALKADGKIKGANGAFTVDENGNVASKATITGETVTDGKGASMSNGTVTGKTLTDGIATITNGNINTTGTVTGGTVTSTGNISAVGDIHAGNAISGASASIQGALTAGSATITGDLTAGGAIQGTSIYDGTATMKNGDITGVKNLSAETITTHGDLTVNGKLNMDEINMTKNGIVGDNNVTASTKVAAGEITSYKKATSTKDGSEKESAIDYDEKGTSTWAKATDADGKWNKSILTVEGTGIKSTATDGTNKTYTKQTAVDIKNTAKNGTITNDAMDVLNKGANSVINKVDDNKVAVKTDSVKAAYGSDTYTTWNGKGITSNTSGNMRNSAKNITNKAEEKLSNSAAEIENSASKSITDKVGENTSWKMTDGKISESIDNGTASNKGNTTVDGTKRIITNDEGTGIYNQTATSNNISLKNAAGDTFFTKSESLNGEKTSVKNPNGSSTINQSAESIVNFVKNSEGTTKTEQSAKDITNIAKDGTITNNAMDVLNKGANSVINKVGDNKVAVKTDRVKVAYGSDTYTTWNDKGITNNAKDKTVKTTAKDIKNTATGDITNTATDKIISQIGDGSAVKSEMTADGITNTAKDGTIYNKSKDILNEASGDIINWADGEIGNVATKITNITGKNTVISDNDGTTFENEDAKTPFVEGGEVNTKITGNKVETGKVLTDDLTVRGTSEFVGRADFRDDVYVDNNLTVAKETRTDTLYVDHDGYVGGNLNVDGNIETHDAVLSADSRQVVTGRQLYQTNERVDRLDNRIKKVGANAAALAALRPGDFNPDDKFSIAAGFGSYRNANAAALGLFYRPNENVLLSLGTSFGDGENMVNAGVSVKFGRGKSMAERRKEMADEVSSMRDEMRSQDERIAELEEMLKKQSELIEKLSKES